MNSTCSFCKKEEAVVFCSSCDSAALLCTRCSDSHKVKNSDEYHDILGIEHLRLFQSVRFREFQARRGKLTLASALVRKLKQEAEQTYEMYKEQLQTAMKTSLQMLEDVFVKYISTLDNTKQDLQLALKESEFSFASQLTEIIYTNSKSLEEDVHPLSVLQDGEVLTHISIFLQTTAATSTAYQESDIENMDHRLLSLFLQARDAGLNTSPIEEIGEARAHPLTVGINEFIEKVYLQHYSTPHSESTLSTRPRFSLKHPVFDYEEIEGPIRIPQGLYYGQRNSNLPHGLGALIFLQNNLRNFMNGDLYIGEFRNGDITGTGELIYADGSYYSGQWEYGERSGIGILVWVDGSQYEGEFTRGVRHGRGKLTYCDGSVYDGYWDKNGREGWGVFWKENTRCEGEWRNDSFSIRGIQAKYQPSIIR